MDNEWNKNFIKGIFINKSRIMKCIDVILTKEEVVFDDVCMIATYSTYEDSDPEQCEMDEVVLSMEFAGYPEELSYLKYKEFFKLIEYGLEEKISRFEESEKEEILKELEKARSLVGQFLDSITETKRQAELDGRFSQITQQPSYQDWNVENCAEVWSIRKAILNGAKFDDINFKCVRTDNGEYAPPCNNCKKTTKDLNNIGKKKQKGKMVK